MIPLKVGRMNVSSSVAHSIFIFFATYMLSVAVLTSLISLTGIDFVTSFSAVIACMTNVAMGFSTQLGPDGTYAVFSDGAKLVLSFAMILGRLEVMTVLVIFSRSFWR